jgi:hypothetical protein
LIESHDIEPYLWIDDRPTTYVIETDMGRFVDSITFGNGTCGVDPHSSGLEILDYDGDGDEDLAFARAAGEKVWVSENTSDLPGDDFDDPRIAADLDQGILDLCVRQTTDADQLCALTEDSVSCITFDDVGGAPGTFTIELIYPIPGVPDRQPTAFSCEDQDANGNGDFVILETGSTANDVSALFTVVIVDENGDPFPGPGVELPWTEAVAVQSSTDFTIVIGSNGDPNLPSEACAFAVGSSAPKLTGCTETHRAGLRSSAVNIADFNGDGSDDFAVANEGSNDVILWLGDGLGHFVLDQRGPFPTGEGPVDIISGLDVNFDGLTEVLTVNTINGNFTAIFSTGILIFRDGMDPQPFVIESVEHPDNAVINGAREDMTIFWSGAPEFPVTCTYRPRTCSPGIRCFTPVQLFETPSNPIEWIDPIWCSGPASITPIFFNYELLCTDSTGQATKPLPAPFTCLGS